MPLYGTLDITLADGSSYVGTVVASDNANDLALVKDGDAIANVLYVFQAVTAHEHRLPLVAKALDQVLHPARAQGIEAAGAISPFCRHVHVRRWLTITARPKPWLWLTTAS